MGRLSSTLPAGAVGGVLDDDAGGGELLADRVGGGEVAGGAGLLASGEAVLDPCGELGIGGRGAGDGEDAEHVVHACEGGAGGIEVGAGDGGELVEGGVGAAD